MTTSAISKLDNDIFLSIFDTITSELPNSEVVQIQRPLTVIRVASHVCRSWRGLLLASPPIWGRVIDLDCEYGPKSLEWMEEVARRAGSAPLWIYAGVGRDDRFDSQSYFIRLLESRWEQIEILSVFMLMEDAKVAAYIRDLCLRPAPILKFFGVDLGRQLVEPHGHGRSELLFADYAPRLQTMSTGHFGYRSDSSWLCNIREINPFPTNSTFTLKDIFDILQNTPLIERIAIDPEEQEYLNQIPYPPVPKVSLPNLTSISVVTTLEVLAWILDHISPGSISNLYIYSYNIDIPSLNDSTILSSLAKNLPLYISSPFILDPTPTVCLVISKSTFNLGKVPSRDVHFYGYSDFPPLFNVTIVLDRLTDASADDWERLIVCLIDAFLESLGGRPSAPKFVTELTMFEIDIQPAIIPKLYSLLYHFRHVQEIFTAEEYGHTLLSLSRLEEQGDGDDDQHVLFPQLRTLRLTSTGPRNGVVSSDITLFLARRKEIGFPVAKLDLTNCKGSNYAQDLRDLEAVGGLEVVWTKLGNGYLGEGDEICSYICGTGHPERLLNLVPPVTSLYGSYRD